MIRIFWHLVAIATIFALSSCGGGGDSSTSALRCATVNCQNLGPTVSTTFIQTNNNLRVDVDDNGPHKGLGINTNVPYVTVTVCELGAVRTDTSRCSTIDHVLVDTGSVGLRVLASKVTALASVTLDQTTGNPAWECFPFVIGGLWGRNAVGDVWMGEQQAPAVRMQLIDDVSGKTPPDNCISITDNSIATTAGALGANGILGIGTTVVDCGGDCANNTYQFDRTSAYVSPSLYYDCKGTSDPKNCTLTSIPTNYQVINPVWNLPDGKLGEHYNNGVVLVMPAIPDSQVGAATAHGELIFGMGSQANNTMPVGTVPVLISTTSNSNSYLSIKTEFKGHVYDNSYLDTGTNGLFFTDTSSTPITSCDLKPLDVQAYWYCPFNDLKNLQALLYDGDATSNSAALKVMFQVANFDVLGGTSNAAFSGIAAGINNLNPSYNANNPAGQSKYIPDTKTFAWGMPFFYGKKVYMSIIDLDAATPQQPWYAWTALPP